MKNVVIYAIVGILFCLCLQPLVEPSYIDAMLVDRNIIDRDIESDLRDNIVFAINSDDTATVKGVVRDALNNSALSDTFIDVYGEDTQGGWYWNYTYSDVNGFYQMNVPAGEFNIYFYRYPYFSEYFLDVIIQEDQTLWINVSLIPYPPVSAFVQGVITDNETGFPIEDVDVNINWQDEYNHWWDNYTSTNESGYYFIGTLAGDVYISVYANGYFYQNTDWFIISENETAWVNISLIPQPKETVLIQGFVVDGLTSNPIEDAYFRVSWKDDQGNYETNSTHTDEYGFFRILAAAGEIRFYCSHELYEPYSSDWMSVSDNETIWVNVSLLFEPTEDASIKGYVKDTVTKSVIPNAYIRCDWRDDQGHQISKQLITDRKGFFDVDIAYGEIQLFVSKLGYSQYQSPWYTVDENHSIIWVNSSVSPEITISFTKPLPGLYIQNDLKIPIISQILQKIMPSFKPIIIGPINISINVTNAALDISHVELYIDGVLRKTFVDAPYDYFWNETAFFTHTIRVLAYDNAGPYNIGSLSVRRFS